MVENYGLIPLEVFILFNNRSRCYYYTRQHGT